jgi:hypothetical protein
VLSISFSIAFIITISIYLYLNRCEKPENKKENTAVNKLKSFIFVWTLLSLLIFYIVTIRMASILLFAIGNIVVEVALIAYTLKISKGKTEQPATEDNPQP